MKIELTVPERLRILNDLLPPEGNIATLRMIRGMVAKIGISPAEYKKFEVVQDPEKGEIKWNTKKGMNPVGIEFADAEREIVKASLTALDTAGKLKPDMISIYDKFFP